RSEYADVVMEYGERVGVAFQLVDDVIDLSPKAEQTGKRAGTDLRAGVVTMPLLLLQQRAETDAEAAELLARIERGGAEIAAGADPALLDPEVEALRAHQVTRDTEAEAHRWAADAVAALEVLPRSEVKRALGQLAESIVAREG